MRISLKVAILFVGIWFLGKLTFFWLGLFQGPDGVKFLIMWNILCLLLGMSLGTLFEIRKEDRSQSTALGDIKKAMAGGLIYSVLVSALLYTYYAKIDPEYNRHQIETMIQRDKEALNNPKMLAEIKQQPDYASLSVEEIIKKRKTGHLQVFNPGTTMTMAMLGLLVLTTINAIVLTIIFRRVLFRQGTF